MNELNNESEQKGNTESESLTEYSSSLNLTPEQQFNPQMSPILIAFIALIGGFILYQVVGGLLTLIVFGLDIENASVNGIRLMTMAGQILFILLPALIIAKFMYTDVTQFFRLKIPDWKEVLLFAIGIGVLTMLLQNYLYIQNYYIDQLANNVPIVKTLKELLDTLNEYLEKTYGTLLKANNVGEAILIVFVVAIVPAISEEFMFRGLVQRSFELKMKPFYAALLTAFFFGANHFNPYGLIPLMILGLYFGFAAYLSGSLLIPVILHFLNNFTAIMLYFIYGDDELISSSVQNPAGLASSFMMVVLLSAVFAAVIFGIKKYYSSKIKI